MKRALFLLVFLSSAWAQPSFRGEISVISNLLLSETFPAQIGWTVAGHLEADYALFPAVFRLVLDPGLRLDREVTAEPGLTEIYASLRQGDFDLSAGLERLPLEVARLSVPFSLEPRNDQGLPQGLVSARVSWYPDLWRLRAVLAYQDERLIPVVSIRRNFEGFELEGHALYTGRATFGLGGSGLVEDTVIYGETWLLLESLEVRGALGLSGFLEDSLWTVEASYGPSLIIPAPHPQFAGQLSLPQEEGAAWLLSANLGLPESGTVGQAGVTYSYSLPDQEIMATLGGRFGPIMALTFNLGITAFF